MTCRSTWNRSQDRHCGKYSGLTGWLRVGRCRERPIMGCVKTQKVLYGVTSGRDDRAASNDWYVQRLSRAEVVRRRLVR
jgi:hypothetical protein